MPERGEPKDFAALYRATIGPLRRYLARMLGSTTEAQDVAHDAYLRMYRSCDGTPSAEKPEAFLYTVARRLAINRIRRRSVSPIVGAELNAESAAAAQPGVAQQVMARQELNLLQAAIDDLPNGCRTVLLLRRVEQLSHREIADRLGIAVSTVEKQHARALRLLRAALPEESLSPRSPAPSAEVTQ